jgi:hypothetical protein
MALADTDAADIASRRVLSKAGLVEIGRDASLVRHQGSLSPR